MTATFSSTLSLYVEVAIEEAGLPKDPQMQWGRWIIAKYGPVLRRYTRSSHVIEEAIIEAVTHPLYNLRLLQPDSPYARFRQDHPALSGKSPEKKVSAFLVMLFHRSVSAAIRYVRKVRPATVATGKATVVITRLDHMNPVEIRRYLSEFKQWYRTPRARASTLLALDFITDRVAEGHSLGDIRDKLIASGLRGRDGQAYTVANYKRVRLAWVRLFEEFRAEGRA